MKLYTEEQVRKAYEIGVEDGDCGEYRQDIEKLNLTPIELPSDEDIENESEITYRKYPSNPKEMTDWKYGEDVNAHRKRKAFIKGAKWMRDKILNK